MFHRAASWRPLALMLALVLAAVVAGSRTGATTPPQAQKPPQRPTTRSPRQTVQAPRQTAAVAKTILKVGLDMADHNAHVWQSTHNISGAEYIDFQWTTSETGIAAARWAVTNQRPGSAGAVVVQSGPVLKTGMAAPGLPGQFVINFGAFIPKQAPAPPLSIKYWVQVIPADAQNHDLQASSTVVVTYVAPEESTFEEGMGTLPWAQEMLAKAHGQFMAGGTGPVTYGLGDALTPVQINGPGIQAYRRYTTVPFGWPASIEVLGTQQDPIVYICVPHGLPNDNPVTWLWFKYTLDRRSNRLVPAVDRDQYPPPVGAPLTQSGMDAFYHDTNFFTGVRWSTVLTVDDRDAGFPIDQLHSFYQASPDSTANFMNMLRARALGQDISERALVSYQHVTLRGVVEVGGFPDSDVAVAHAMGYAIGDFVPTGPPLMIWYDGCMWPGMDWDMKVTPDPAYMYLKSADRDDVGVEIESFALRGPDDPCGPDWEQQSERSYMPVGKNYLQATGRWVTDNAHDSDLEIHPPELLAITRLDGQSATITSVTATGAWRGKAGAVLTFVVNPPDRPAADARLKWDKFRLDGSLGFDRQDNATLDCEERGPIGNPNHLFCVIRATGDGPIVLVEDGMVGLQSGRGLKTIIRAWWDAKTADVGGTATDGSGPALGTFVFYRDNTLPGMPWSHLRVDSQGGFTLRNLTAGKPYSIVAAGSGWSFPQGRVVKTFQASVSSGFKGSGMASGGQSPPPPNPPLTFIGTRIKHPLPAGPLRPHQGFVRSNAPRVSTVNTQAGAQPGHPFSVALQAAQQAIARPGSGSMGVLLVDQQAARDILRSILVSFTEPEGEYGVAHNGLGYRERGTVLVQLKGLVGADGKPVPGESSAYSISGSGPSRTITVNGVPTATVPGARIRARLMLGNQWTGYRVAAMTDTTTGYNGFARLKFQTGSAVEEMTIDVEVLENPFNPWFLPRIGGAVHITYPAAGPGSSAGRGRMGQAVALRPAAYTLEATPLTAMGGARSASVVGGDADEFARLKRALDKSNEMINLAAKPSLLKPVRRKAVDVDKR